MRCLRTIDLQGFQPASSCAILYRLGIRVFQLKSYPIEIPSVGRNDITPVMLSAAKRSRNIPHSDWTIIFPDYSKEIEPPMHTYSGVQVYQAQ
jgi:hypothetical protein